MAHDATKAALGSSASNVKDCEVFDADPASFPAGSVLSLASTGLPSLAVSAGMRLGVSRGKSLSDHKMLSVQRTGLRVPVLAHLKRSTGTITVTSFANLVSGTDDVVTIGATAFTAQAGAATPGDATFQAATDNATTAASLATQINAHATAGALVYAVASAAVVTLYAKVEGAGTGHDVAVSYTDNDTNVGITLAGLTGGKLAGGSNTISEIAYAVKGAKMYVNNTTGKADIAMGSFTTITDAIYFGGAKTGIDESLAEVAAVEVDMPGGL